MHFMENDVKMINKVLENFDSFMTSWKGKECKSRYNNFVCGKCVNGVVVKKFTNNKDLEWWQVGGKAYTVYRHKTDTNEVRPSVVNVSTNYKDDFAKAILKVSKELYLNNCASLKEIALDRKEKALKKAQKKKNAFKTENRIPWKKAINELVALSDFENSPNSDNKKAPDISNLIKVAKFMKPGTSNKYFTKASDGDLCDTDYLIMFQDSLNEGLTEEKNDGKNWHYHFPSRVAFFEECKSYYSQNELYGQSMANNFSRLFDIHEWDGAYYANQLQEANVNCNLYGYFG